jgi:hypothetical protein
VTGEQRFGSSRQEDKGREVQIDAWKEINLFCLTLGVTWWEIIKSSEKELNF